MSRRAHLNLMDVHCALETVVLPFLMEEDYRPAADSNDPPEQSAQNSKESSFHDLLHDYALFARPKTAQDLQDLVKLVCRLVTQCTQYQQSDDRDYSHKNMNLLPWKVVTLTAFLRRYHYKAPEARKRKQELTRMTKAQGNKEKKDNHQDHGVGDGERLIYYTTLLTLHRYWRERSQQHSHEHKHAPETAQWALEGASAMVRSAVRIGGTRDLCAILQHLTLANLREHGIITIDNTTTAATTDNSMTAPEKFADKLVPALHALAVAPKHPDALLDLTLTLVAKHLDDDLTLLEEMNQDTNKENVLLSTIHVMLPHNQRGSNTYKSWQRKLVNGVAEIMLWKRTVHAGQLDGRFVKAWENFSLLPPTAIEQGHALILQMQTTARKHRQLLNKYARQQGFLLTSSYLMDKSSLNLQHIRRAKAGDLQQLEKLARKQRDSRILKMIANRNLDPTKARAVESVLNLITGWIDTRRSGESDDDEIAALEIANQTSTVQATLDKLRCPSTRPVWVTCQGFDQTNVVCAILVAASLEKSRLFLNGEEYDVSSTENCIALLNEAIRLNKFAQHSSETSLSVQDMLLSKVKPSQDLLVVSASDLELDEKVLQGIQQRDITIRVHSPQRIEPVGKVSLSLNETISDRIKAGQSFSLGVMLDCTGSMGGEIEGCKKGAVEMISTFQSLAPVSHVNILGYWDPVNVHTDPQPRSTGYMEASQEKMAELKAFVNSQLVCEGGGDEPEDIPGGLEKLIDDCKIAGLSADNGVNLVFFIADAGFRHGETARVRNALLTLKEMGIVMVMCPVRTYSDSLQTMIGLTKEYFESAGQYVELPGVGQIAAIASSVTQSIRASLFESSVVSVTASVGHTIDAIRKLAAFQLDHGALKETEKLVKMEDEAMGEDEPEEKTVLPKVIAEEKEFKLTSRDRLYLELSRLPDICHHEVATAFGGKSLQELAATQIADRLRDEGIPLAEVRKAGYPKDILDMVRDLLSGHGIGRVAM